MTPPPRLTRFVQTLTGGGPAPVAADTLRIFVATTITSPNVREHYLTKAKRTKTQREAVARAVWAALRNPAGPGLAWTVTNPGAPKRVEFTAHVARRFDSHDNLRMALKPMVDGLIDAGLLVDDRDAAGHAFVYAQAIDGRRGVEISVRVRG